MILAAAARFRTEFDGVQTWHCFSTGAHYDPDNVAFGALIGVDEHLVAAGAGFGWHPHRGVAIVSWVVAGRLRHEDDAGQVRFVEPGRVFVQQTGSGIRHVETNASPTRPLRLIQLTFLADRAAEPAITTTEPSVDLGPARFDVWRAGATTPDSRWHLFVTAGSWQCGPESLGPGDSVRGSGRIAVDGTGELLVCELA
ncbi:MAG TPA: pirin family protein [Jatrophihabitans sp.]